MKKIMYHLGMISIAIAFFLLTYYMYLSFYPIEVVRLNEPIITKEQQVSPGDLLTVPLNFTKLRDIPASDIQWSLVDGIFYAIPSGKVYREGGDHEILRQIEIPKVVAPGTYHAEISIKYQITPLRTITYLWKSNQFEVVE